MLTKTCTGFSLNYDDQLTYNKFIANEARKRGLNVGLKNDLDQIQLTILSKKRKMRGSRNRAMLDFTGLV